MLYALAFILLLGRLLLLYLYHAVAVDVHNIELFAVAVVADDALLKILLLLHLAAPLLGIIKWISCHIIIM